MFFRLFVITQQSYKIAGMPAFRTYTEATRRIIAVTLTGLILLIQPLILSGQQYNKEVPPLGERFFYGGSFGLMFGSITDIEASPIVGFWVLPRLAVAAGPNYRFYKDRIDKTTIYGGRIYTDLVVIRDFSSLIPVGTNFGIFLHAENEFLSLESAFWKNPPVFSERFWINTILAGPGISQMLGRRSSLNFMVLWALNETEYGVYSNPELRVSFTF